MNIQCRRWRQSQSQGQSETKQQSNNSNSILESVTGIGALEQHGEDYTEITFANRMEYEVKERQRKQKRRDFLR